MPRDWGWWTEQKLDILSDYLAAFTTASTRAGTTVYLDLFAGQPENVSRERSGHIIRGSARRALDTSPPFTVLKFFELSNNAAALDRTLRGEYPDRNFQVVPGDCNQAIDQVLHDLRPLNWAPTFAFLDQQSTEVKWTTLERLAGHKRANKPKVELWLLCASGLLPRGLRLRQAMVDDDVADQMTLMFGTTQWHDALIATREQRLSGAQFRDELTNLMRWRLERDLGYKSTRVFKIKNTGGSEIFDMIFATDHAVGDKIMKSVYSKAMKRQGALQERARQQRKQSREEKDGYVGLFDVDEVMPTQTRGFTVHTEDVPARPPYRRVDRE
ncbi:three-Cys-motif partner protein TcmP [Acrocarpospora catenulata]|uniref:three-Cys-motif partner protein TcmP n=1 Tax=Acrocarpospora catenulata TaxID=2836182 RepID=UPI001BDA6012|nr:three-Cys-motif partner protein TcmP [Acrocarpospora catenulata]